MSTFQGVGIEGFQEVSSGEKIRSLLKVYRIERFHCNNGRSFQGNYTQRCPHFGELDQRGCDKY